MSLIPIGRFSKMTRLSVKALRRYDEIGLLTPAHVDPASGYRYYALGQAARAETVRILRSIDVPLDDIRAVLSTTDPAGIRGLLMAHRERLAERLATQERMLAYLEALIRKEGLMPYDIEITEAPPQRIAATRVHTGLRDIGAAVGGGFATLMQAVGMQGLAVTGPPLVVYHDIIDEETDGDVEICVPVAGEVSEAPGVYGRDLEGGPMATTVHRGPYDQIARAYHTLTAWVSEHGHESAGPPRETYLNDPQTVPPEELLTRVEFPIVAEG